MNRTFLPRVALLIVFLGLAPCGPTPVEYYDPPLSPAVFEKQRIELPVLRYVSHYSFSPDGHLLILGGGAFPLASEQKELNALSTNSAVMILEWPSLDIVFQYNYAEDLDREYPIAYHWDVTNNRVWISWAPAGQISWLDLEAWKIHDTMLQHGGFVISADGEHVIAWGDVASAQPASPGFEVVDAHRMYVYTAHDLRVEQEVNFPSGGTITGLYETMDPGVILVSHTADECDHLRLLAPSIANLCTDATRSLYQWSLDDNRFELYWEAFSQARTSLAGAFNPDTQLLIGVEDSRYLVFYDVERRCPIQRLERWVGGQHTWYDDRSFVQLLQSEDLAPDPPAALAIYELAILQAFQAPCLPSPRS